MFDAAKVFNQTRRRRQSHECQKDAEIHVFTWIIVRCSDPPHLPCQSALARHARSAFVFRRVKSFTHL
jgi:hypothetical protein